MLSRIITFSLEHRLLVLALGAVPTLAHAQSADDYDRVARKAAPWQRCGAAWHRFGSDLRQIQLVMGVRVKGVVMARENVVVVRFTEPSKAYQALSVLKECDADGRIGLESAAVVERTAAGELQIPESADSSQDSGKDQNVYEDSGKPR